MSGVGGDDLGMGKGNPTAQAAAETEGSAKTQNRQGPGTVAGGGRSTFSTVKALI